MKTLRQIFLHELAETYHAEKQIARTLPKLIKGCSDQLCDALQDHLEDTQDQVERLEQVFSIMDKVPKARKNHAMAALIADALEILETAEGPGAEAALIAALQKIEHYEIAAYGALCSWAGLLRESDVARLLRETIKEEKNQDELLTIICESTINTEPGQEEKDPAGPRGITPKGTNRRSSPRN
jgi:ferritin-like metal-binding protein YciE